MANPTELSSDVVTGATALAGLLLVYIGSVASSYASFEATQQPAVRTRYQRRAWFGFGGMALAIVAAALALVGKWMGSQCIASVAIALLLLALIWGLITAAMTSLEVR